MTKIVCPYKLCRFNLHHECTKRRVELVERKEIRAYCLQCNKYLDEPVELLDCQDFEARDKIAEGP